VERNRESIHLVLNVNACRLWIFIFFCLKLGYLHSHLCCGVTRSWVHFGLQSLKAEGGKDRARCKARMQYLLICLRPTSWCPHSQPLACSKRWHCQTPGIWRMATSKTAVGNLWRWVVITKKHAEVQAYFLQTPPSSLVHPLQNHSVHAPWGMYVCLWVCLLSVRCTMGHITLSSRS